MLSLLLVLYANNKLPWIGPHQIKLLQLRRIQYPCWFVWKMASKKNVVNPWAMDPVVTDCKSEGLQCSLFHYICLLHWQISHEFIPWRSQLHGVSFACIANGVMPCCNWPSPCAKCQPYQPIWRAHVLYFHGWQQPHRFVFIAQLSHRWNPTFFAESLQHLDCYEVCSNQNKPLRRYTWPRAMLCHATLCHAIRTTLPVLPSASCVP
jgi:hypothetical protein